MEGANVLPSSDSVLMYIAIAYTRGQSIIKPIHGHKLTYLRTHYTLHNYTTQLRYTYTVVHTTQFNVYKIFKCLDFIRKISNMILSINFIYDSVYKFQI